MAIVSYDDLLNRVGGGYSLSQPFGGLIESTAVVLGGNNVGFHKLGNTKALPSLPSGVSAYIPTSLSAESGVSGTYSIIVAQMIDLGSLNIATPTFTDGSSMPTKTELGVSRVTSGPVFIEVRTALNATPGNLTVTYVDQDGNSAETTSNQALGASAPVGSSGFIVLNSPDVGVRDITTASRSGGTTPTGVIKFWGIIPIGIVNMVSTSAGMGEFKNLLTGAFNCQRLPASTVIGAFAMSTAAKSLQGQIFFVGDS